MSEQAGLRKKSALAHGHVDDMLQGSRKNGGGECVRERERGGDERDAL